MGFSSGTTLMDGVIRKLNTSQRFKDDEQARKEIYMYLIDELEEVDWDCQEESMGTDVAYDEALKELHPDWDYS